MATLYGLGKKIKLTDLSGEEMDWMAKDYAPKFLSVAAGLFRQPRTTRAFCQMMLNRGELDGERLLGRKDGGVDDDKSPSGRDTPNQRCGR